MDIKKTEEEIEEQRNLVLGLQILGALSKYQVSNKPRTSKLRGKGYTRADKSEPKKKRLMRQKQQRIQRKKGQQNKHQRV